MPFIHDLMQLQALQSTDITSSQQLQALAMFQFLTEGLQSPRLVGDLAQGTSGNSQTVGGLRRSSVSPFAGVAPLPLPPAALPGAGGGGSWSFVLGRKMSVPRKLVEAAAQNLPLLHVQVK